MVLNTYECVDLSLGNFRYQEKDQKANEDVGNHKIEPETLDRSLESYWVSKNLKS